MAKPLDCAYGVVKRFGELWLTRWKVGEEGARDFREARRYDHLGWTGLVWP